jgi:hypothetical protein
LADPCIAQGYLDRTLRDGECADAAQCAGRGFM